MKIQTLKDMEWLAAKTGFVLIATADKRGQPHVAAAGRLALTSEKHIMVTEWFCPGTMSNLQVNSRLSVVVWDRETDSGYQFIGELEAVNDLGVLNGYSSKEEQMGAVPQVERQLLLHVNKVLEFKHKPHSDTEE